MRWAHDFGLDRSHGAPAREYCQVSFTGCAISMYRWSGGDDGALSIQRRGSGWVPVGSTDFKSAGMHPSMCAEGSTPLHSRQFNLGVSAASERGRRRNAETLFC